MKYKRYNVNEIIELTRDAIHAFTERDMKKFSSYLDEAFSFIADDAPLFLRTKTAFMESTRTEMQAPSVTIQEEEYTLLAHDNHIWVTFGRFTVSCPPDTASIHFTFVWQQKGDDMLLLHANAAHARGIPEEALNTASDTTAPQAHMFDDPAESIQVIRINNNLSLKTPYHDLEGHVRFVSDEELIYVESLGKTCLFHVAGQSSFSVRTSLRSLNRPGFMDIHRSYLVNLSYIRSICRYQVTLTNGTQLPIGKEKYMELKKRLTDK